MPLSLSLSLSFSLSFSPLPFFLSKINKKYILKRKSILGAEGKIPRIARFGEFPFRNIPYIRKALNCSDYKVFTSKQKEMILAPLSSLLQLWPKVGLEASCT